MPAFLLVSQLIHTAVCFCLHLFQLQFIHGSVGIVHSAAWVLLFCFFFDGRASPFHGSLIHFVGLQLPSQVFSFVVLIGLKSIVRCCTRASHVHLSHLLCFISMAPRPNSSSGNDILPPCIFLVLLIGFSSLSPHPILMCPSTQWQGEVVLGGEGSETSSSKQLSCCEEQPQPSLMTGEQNRENFALETRCTFSALKAVA